MGKATWGTAWFQAAIYQQLLEEPGYTVADPGVLDNIAFCIFSAQGDIDLLAIASLPCTTTITTMITVADHIVPVGYEVGQEGSTGI